MDLRVLNYFLTVSEEGTITKAANSLHISQPALSKQLKDLEEELGTQLFVRGNKRIALTDSGEYLKKQSKEILSLVKQTTNTLSQNDIVEGEISIGCGETHAFELIASTLSRLQKKYPAVTIRLYSGNADSIIEMLNTNSIDFGLVIDPVNKKHYEHIRLPLVDHWGILVNDSHHLYNKALISSTDLVGSPLLISNQTLVDNQLSEWLGMNLEYLTIIGSYNLLYNASVLAKNSDIAVLCIDGIINTHGSNLKFIPLVPMLETHSSIIWKNDRTLSTVSNLFINELTQLIKDK